MFLFFSNKTGCLGSLVVSVIGTLVIVMLMKGCQQAPISIIPIGHPVPALTLSLADPAE